MELNYFKKSFYALAAIALLASCNSAGKKGSKSTGFFPESTAPGTYKPLTNPKGMVYIPQGTFQMGPNDEDPAYAFSSRSRTVSVNGFWMDKYETTNNQYRTFVKAVRDSVSARPLDKMKAGDDGTEYVDYAAMDKVNWNDPATIEALANAGLIIAPEDRINGKKAFDNSKLIYLSEKFDFGAAASRGNIGKPRSEFIIRDTISIYPDTNSWVRDFAYSYNEPHAKKYFSHASYGEYPVVGISWKQATAFCIWKSNYLQTRLEEKKREHEADYRLPTEAEWEYAARGGLNQAMYPWGNYYIRNQKGCLLANFKPGRGNYAEDQGFYTVRVDSYNPNDYGLYNMSGNVAEWTNTMYYEGRGNFQHDMNPDIRWNAKDSDDLSMKRKVVRGGSWKDVAYYLQVGVSSYEYQDSAKSYIGMRSIIDLPAPTKSRR